MQIGQEIEMTSNPPWVRVFCWRRSHFMEMQETTNYCIMYNGGRVYGH